jgi:hypothetical protein
MSELTPAISEAFVRRMMRALSMHAATANGADIEDGLKRLDRYRCAWRGERNDEEKAEAANRALGLLCAWCMEPSKPDQESGE